VSDSTCSQRKLSYNKTFCKARSLTCNAKTLKPHTKQELHFNHKPRVATNRSVQLKHLLSFLLTKLLFCLFFAIVGNIHVSLAKVFVENVVFDGRVKT